MKNIHLFIATSFLVSLFGCGGGGSAPVTTPQVTTPPTVTPPSSTFAANAAMIKLLSSSRQWSLSGKASDGNDYQASFTISPLADAAFPIGGALSRRSKHELILTKNNIADTRTTVHSYQIDAFPVLYGAEMSDASCAKVSSARSVPASAIIGASSEIVSDGYVVPTCFTPVAPTGYYRIKWSLEFDQTLSYFCLEKTQLDLGLKRTDSEKICLEVFSDGSLGSRARIDLAPSAGVSLTLRTP